MPPLILISQKKCLNVGPTDEFDYSSFWGNWGHSLSTSGTCNTNFNSKLTIFLQISHNTMYYTNQQYIVCLKKTDDTSLELLSITNTIANTHLL